MQDLILRRLGNVEYHQCWQAMRHFNASRTADSSDEIWLLQHPAVFTLGLNAKREHLLQHDTAIPVVECDRGGEITYHGPGQWVAYILMDLRRRSWGVKQLVHAMEQSIIDLLQDYSLVAQRREGAPGIYVAKKKIASLGLRVRNGASYHGLALNVDMDLTPFSSIAPCGYQDLEMTQLADLTPDATLQDSGTGLITHLTHNLGYNSDLIHMANALESVTAQNER